MTAALIPFYRYSPQEGDYYKVYFEALLNGLKIWGDEVDKVYLIDQEWNFSPLDKARLQKIKPNSEILKSEVTGHHWEQFKWALNYVSEDKILFMDNDVLIWKKGVIEGWFKKAEKADVVSAFDGSGGLKWLVQEKFPILKKNNDTRMGSYYFILDRSIFEKIPDFDFAPQMPYPIGTYIKELDYTTVEGDWSDSFGLFTIKLLSLNPTVDFIFDDRSSIYYPDIKIGQANQLGYYHIRNGNLPIYTLASKISHPEDYERTLKITPIHELTRLFAWFDYLSDYHEEVRKVMEDVGILGHDWDSFMLRFKEFHGL